MSATIYRFPTPWQKWTPPKLSEEQFIYRFKCSRKPPDVEDYIPSVQWVDVFAANYREACEKVSRMVGPEFVVVRLPV